MHANSIVGKLRKVRRREVDPKNSAVQINPVKIKKIFYANEMRLDCKTNPNEDYLGFVDTCATKMKSNWDILFSINPKILYFLID